MRGGTHPPTCNKAAAAALCQSTNLTWLIVLGDVLAQERAGGSNTIGLYGLAHDDLLTAENHLHIETWTDCCP